MEVNNNFDIKDFNFDLEYLIEERKVKFDWNENIRVIMSWWDEIIFNFLDFSYELDWTTYSFSPFHINFYFLDEYNIKEVYIPLFLKEKYFKALEEKRIEEVKKTKEKFKSTYNIIINNYE